jgi:hypothetical protein
MRFRGHTVAGGKVHPAPLLRIHEVASVTCRLGGVVCERCLRKLQTSMVTAPRMFLEGLKRYDQQEEAVCNVVVTAGLLLLHVLFVRLDITYACRLAARHAV